MFKDEFVFFNKTENSEIKLINKNEYVLLNTEKEQYDLSNSNYYVLNNLILNKNNSNKNIVLNYYNFMELLNTISLLELRINKLEKKTKKRKHDNNEFISKKKIKI